MGDASSLLDRQLKAVALIRLAETCSLDRISARVYVSLVTNELSKAYGRDEQGQPMFSASALEFIFIMTARSRRVDPDRSECDGARRDLSAELQRLAAHAEAESGATARTEVARLSAAIVSGTPADLAAAELYVRRANILLSQRRYGDAEDDLRRAIVSEPSESAEAHLALSLVYERMGKPYLAMRETARARFLHARTDEALERRYRDHLLLLNPGAQAIRSLANPLIIRGRTVPWIMVAVPPWFGGNAAFLEASAEQADSRVIADMATIAQKGEALLVHMEDLIKHLTSPSDLPVVPQIHARVWKQDPSMSKIFSPRASSRDELEAGLEKFAESLIFNFGVAQSALEGELRIKPDVNLHVYLTGGFPARRVSFRITNEAGVEVHRIAHVIAFAPGLSLVLILHADDNAIEDRTREFEVMLESIAFGGE